MAITVPVAILAAAAVGLIWGLLRIRRDRLPFYFLVHLLTLPMIRMFPTPAHDGVRLFLPTFFFLRPSRAGGRSGWRTPWPGCYGSPARAVAAPGPDRRWCWARRPSR